MDPAVSITLISFLMIATVLIVIANFVIRFHDKQKEKSQSNPEAGEILDEPVDAEVSPIEANDKRTFSNGQKRTKKSSTVPVSGNRMMHLLELFDSMKASGDKRAKFNVRSQTKDVCEQRSKLPNESSRIQTTSNQDTSAMEFSPEIVEDETEKPSANYEEKEEEYQVEEELEGAVVR